MSLAREQTVRQNLSNELGMLLEKKKLVIGRRLNGQKIWKEFDLVSRDDEKELVGEIKCYKLGNSTTGKSGYTTTRIARLLMACFYLKRLKARRKLLVLSNKELYEQFRRGMDGLLDKQIEIKYVSDYPIPARGLANAAR
jgi:hypothetical protein